MRLLGLLGLLLPGHLSGGGLGDEEADAAGAGGLAARPADDAALGRGLAEVDAVGGAGACLSRYNCHRYTFCTNT